MTFLSSLVAVFAQRCEAMPGFTEEERRSALGCSTEGSTTRKARQCPHLKAKKMVAGPGAGEAPSLLLKLPQFLVFNLKNNR